MMFFILCLTSIIHLSIEKCLEEKVSITIDLVKDTRAFPLEADSKQFLWHVAILKQGEVEVKFLCSGTVVGLGHVLTAASCVVNVPSSELRVVAGLSLLRSSSHAVENPHSVFTVAKKYYRYRRGNFAKDDLAVLKLKNKATFKAPKLATLEAKDKYSKNCFTLGWGVHNKSSDSSKCLNPSFQDSINNVQRHAEQSTPILSTILDIRNMMGLSSMFIFQLSKMLDILPGLLYYGYGSSSKYSRDATCAADELSRIKAVRLTTKHPYKCLCRNTSRICLYSTGVEDISHQVDIGSPVFCKLKKPKTKSRLFQTSLSNFVLAGIITNKKTKEVRWLNYGSSINMITATNVTTLTDFILAMMFDKS